jgi:5-methylcytosine-specific restriction endonuclease McrA
MSTYTLSHLSDQSLLRELRSLAVQDRATTAMLVAHVGEVDSRRLYAPAGYPSMYEYCVQELHFSEQTAFKRIRVGRLARQFPAIHGLLAEGKLHLSGLVTLSAYLTPANADDLLAAAAHRSKAQIEQLLAERFPQPDLPTLIAPLAPSTYAGQLSPGRVNFSPAKHAAPAPESPAPPTPPARVAPLAPERFAIQCTVDRETHDLIRYAQALLGHTVPSGDLPEAIRRAFACLVGELERQKFAKTDRPRPCQRSEHARQIPASVKRAVWERDGGRCTFVGENGHRCESCTRLEFDHVEPVAQGGQATVQGLRLRCRAHNHYEAERKFGRDFMSTKRETGGRQPLPEHAAEVVPWLRTLGLRAEEARRWAACCGGMPDAPLEQRVRHALKCSARLPRQAGTHPVA